MASDAYSSALEQACARMLVPRTIEPMAGRVLARATLLRLTRQPQRLNKTLEERD